jgi:hypothetical protein
MRKRVYMYTARYDSNDIKDIALPSIKGGGRYLDVFYLENKKKHKDIVPCDKKKGTVSFLEGHNSLQVNRN